jgi:hypothetical protein
MLIAKSVRYVLDVPGNYTPIFPVAGTAYFLGLAPLHYFSPRRYPIGAGPESIKGKRS